MKRNVFLFVYVLLSFSALYFVQHKYFEKNVVSLETYHHSVLAANTDGFGISDPIHASLLTPKEAPKLFASVKEGLAFLDANEEAQICALPAQMDKPLRKTLVSVAEDILLALVEGRHQNVYRQLNPALKKHTALEDIQKQWDALLKETGPFMERISSSEGQCNDKRFVYFTLLFEKTKLDATIVFDLSNRVSGISFKPVIFDYRKPAVLYFKTTSKMMIKSGTMSSFELKIEPEDKH